jgi:hypothetical protein
VLSELETFCGGGQLSMGAGLERQIAKALEEKQRDDAANALSISARMSRTAGAGIDHTAFLDLNPRVLAEALTLHSYKLFERIRTVEFFNEGWNKPQTQ